jgi:hypothetical protein
MAFPFETVFLTPLLIHNMRTLSRSLSSFLLASLLLAGCASHTSHDFIPNGAALNLAPTDAAHIQVLDSIPRGMIIGTVLVDRSKAHDTADIIAAARQKAAAVGGDFIVWEDSLGTLPVATPTPGEPMPSQNTGELGHGTANVEPVPEETTEKTPKARFTVGIYLDQPTHAPGQ